MYERPTLITIGDAGEVIRGLASNGFDLDGLLIIQDHEFQTDSACETTIGE